MTGDAIFRSKYLELARSRLAPAKFLKGSSGYFRGLGLIGPMNDLET